MVYSLVSAQISKKMIREHTLRVLLQNSLRNVSNRHPIPRNLRFKNIVFVLFEGSAFRAATGGWNLTEYGGITKIPKDRVHFKLLTRLYFTRSIDSFINTCEL